MATVLAVTVDGCQRVVVPDNMAVVRVHVVEVAAHRVGAVFNQQFKHVYEVRADSVVRVDHLVG